MATMFDDARDRVLSYLKGIDGKLKTYGKYGESPITKEDIRNESVAAMTEKYGEAAMIKFMERHERKN